MCIIIDIGTFSGCRLERGQAHPEIQELDGAPNKELKLCSGQLAMASLSEVVAFSGCRWAHSTEHPPPQELKETLYNAAYHAGAHGLHASATDHS